MVEKKAAVKVISQIDQEAASSLMHLEKPSGLRMLLVLGFAVTSLGTLGLLGALILRLVPSLFWAITIAKYCKLPIHLLFPANMLIVRSIQSQIAIYESEDFSRNPYVEKAEKPDI